MATVQAPLAVGGSRVSGSSVRSQNVMACNAIANVVKTSLGPVGLDKMLVNDIGDVQITNDGATILGLIDVEHPAGKVLVDLAKLQDEEVGDGTTSVVLIAAELLKNAEELVENKIHPTSIISGYRLACKEACKYIQENLTISMNELGRERAVAAARTSLSSKLVSTTSDFFANMVVDAVTAVKTPDSKGGFVYPIKSVHVLKATGKSPNESMLVPGFALNCTVAHQLMPRYIKNAKIALLDFSLQKAKMHLGVHVLINDPDKLEGIRER
ncbi:T-complex protein 1 subunit alpha, partial [Fragariocoptes setiger]